MSIPGGMDRRSMLIGLGAASVAAAAAPAFARPAGRGGPEAFEARSSDGTVLIGDAVGDPEAPEILFIHGLRQSRLSWSRQLDDATLGRLPQGALRPSRTRRLRQAGLAGQLCRPRPMGERRLRR